MYYTGIFVSWLEGNIYTHHRGNGDGNHKEETGGKRQNAVHISN